MEVNDLLAKIAYEAETGTDNVMLNIAGRWTGIKSISMDENTGTIFIESED
jgi:hypothetical protein